MFETRFRRPSPAMVVAVLALFVALGGSSYAALKVGSKQIVNNSVRSNDIRNNDVRSGDVRDRSLLSKDFKAGHLPAGAQGPKGDRGDRGPAGTPNPNAVNAQNADKLDGVDSTAFVRRSITRRADFNELSGNESAGSSFAACEPGEVVLGGGFSKSNNINPVDSAPGVVQSNGDPIKASPGSEPTGWIVIATRFDMNVTGSFAAYGLCGS